jgi:hypothetical protein
MSFSNSFAIPYGYKKVKMHLANQNKVYADNHSCLKIDMANIKQGAGVKIGDLTDLRNNINGNRRDRSVEAWSIHTSWELWP